VISLSVVPSQQRNPTSCLVHSPDRKVLAHLLGVFLPEKAPQVAIFRRFTPDVLIAGRPIARVGDAIC
jgi:hypothetical protein